MYSVKYYGHNISVSVYDHQAVFILGITEQKAYVSFESLRYFSASYKRDRA